MLLVQCAMMASPSMYRVFFLSTVVIWMFATMYVLRVGTGTTAIKDSPNAVESFEVMEELEKQNIQLKEIAEKMRVIEMRKLSQPNSEEEGNDLLGVVQSQLIACNKKNQELSTEIKAVHLKNANTKSLPERIEQKSDANDEKNSIDSLTRSTFNQITELWYFIQSSLNNLKNDKSLSEERSNQISEVINDIRSRKSAALVEVELLQDLQKEVREREMQKLGELVQRRFHYLQNPKNCDAAKKLVCNLNKGCGFGCQLHHVTYCFLVAIGTQRTFVLDSKNWRYSHEGWESVFKPLSETCTRASGNPTLWNGEEQSKNVKDLTLPIVDGMMRRPPYLPLNVPEDLYSKLVQFHGDPAVWWLGQVVSYLMRPQQWLEKSIAEFEKAIGFSHPIVGIHIRRTDKVGSEAAFHSVAEYMTHVVDWYEKINMKRQRQQKPPLDNKLVYVASDDTNVLEEARRLYPDFKFLGDTEISKNAGTSLRYSKTGLVGVLTDIILLSKCDYIVGTFSSQVSRVAYELMQTLHPDAASYAHSLDDVFYFGGQGAHSQKVIYDHDAKPGSDEISLHAGDFVGVAGNHWDGFSKGVNRRTNAVGLYPSYKVVEVITKSKFPTYDEASIGFFNRTKGTN
ncbi:alpha-(1,6)-fucosyltransferase-like [Styela clava]